MSLRFILLTASLFVSLSLTAGLEEHFRKIDSKPASHSIRNIDYIYMINLDERPEKYASCIKQLHSYGIYPFRFSAINGWELPLQVINSLGVKCSSSMPHDLWGTTYSLGDGAPHHEVMNVPGRNYFCHYLTRGAIGIVLSHLSILQDAYDSGYNTIWIMEDDIEVIQDPKYLSILIDKLDALVGKKKWDILFTDQDTKGKNGQYVPCLGYARKPNFTPVNPKRFSIRKQISKDFRRIGARYGAYSMIVRRHGMKKILDFIKQHQIFLPYDMEFYLPHDIRMYTVIKDVVSTQPQALSDNGFPGYKK